MRRLDVSRTRELLQGFEFQRLFLDQLGWTQPKHPETTSLSVGGAELRAREIAQLGAAVFEVTSKDGSIPESKVCAAVHKELAGLYPEILLVFVDGERRESLWYWVKREGGRLYPREHYFSREQPGDLFLSKLAGLVVDVSELKPGGDAAIAEVALRLRQALDVERVTKRFYGEYQTQHLAFIEHISGIENERDRRWYASVLLNRLMFVYFLQKKGFLDRGDTHYLRHKLDKSRDKGPDLYYERFLRLLFFEGFAKPEAERTAETNEILGEVRYLDGGLFLPHRVELENPEIRIPDEAFDNLLGLFERYSWSLNDTPGGQDDEINPDVLGYIFEKYINQKAYGAYYTRPEITEYLCEQTIYKLILDRVNGPETPELPGLRRYETIGELFLRLDAPLCRRLLLEILPSLTILDPACGSGAFLVAALKMLINVYAAVLGKVRFLKDRNLRDWLKDAESKHASIHYFLKKRVITDNLFGVDLMEEATEIARLRLFLALVSSAGTVEELEPLPNIDFNILSGNSLIGLLSVDAHEFERRSRLPLLQKSYSQLLAEKNRLVDQFRHASKYADDLRALRDDIERHKRDAAATLDDILLGEFQALKIRFEQATWDAKKSRAGATEKRPLTVADIQALEPFHWGYHFDQVLASGGFDAILTNPPWEAWKPQAKEFFAEHSGLVTKNKMTIKEFEREQAKLLKNPEIRGAWLAYQSRFPHVSLYFRSAPQFKNQIATVTTRDGKEKKAGTDVNLYKLFLEQCFNLLRDGGRCGILLQTSIYTDLGAKQLREMLFTQARVEALFGLSNERFLFEGVDHRFRICLVAFRKGGSTDTFEAAFRVDPREAISASKLEPFLHSDAEHLMLSTDLVRRLSPGSLALMEFKADIDIRIAEKMLRSPALGESIVDSWSLKLVREFEKSKRDQSLFHARRGPGRLPLFTGSQFGQMELTSETPQAWIDEAAGQKRVGNTQYRFSRWVHRRIARSVDSRTMISTMAPPMVFTETNSTTLDASQITQTEMLFLCGISNSFAFDWLLRKKVDDTVSQFILYEMPVPRLKGTDPAAAPITRAVAKLVCTNPAYTDLWREATHNPWAPESGATDPAERARLRAELDGLVAHLYGLTDEEFAHILSTFPVVTDQVKDAALAAYRDLAPKAADPELAPLLLAGEGPRLEFKASLRWDLKEGRKNPEIEKVVLKTVAGFLNAEGGTLLLGVADDGSPVGLEPDLKTLQKKNRDGLELFLTDLLLGAFGKDLAPCFRSTFHRVGEKDLCRLDIAPGPRPAFLRDGNDEAFYLRAGNSTRRLSLSETLAYEKRRWGGA